MPIVEKHIGKSETKWLAEHAIDALNVSKACHICGDPSGYEIVDTKGGIRIIQYVAGGGKGMCRRCWKFNRLLDAVLDLTIKYFWTEILLRYSIKIWRLMWKMTLKS